VLLFGLDRERHFLDALIHTGRFAESARGGSSTGSDTHVLSVPAIDQAIPRIEKQGCCATKVEDFDHGISNLRHRVRG